MKIGTLLDTKTEINLPLESLKRHFIALGSSGSGKTVLCKVLIEEAAKSKIPAIIIDLQGDLASLSTLKANVKIYTPASEKGIPICINPFEKTDDVSVRQHIANSIVELLGYKLNSQKGKSFSAALFVMLEQNKNLKDFHELIDVIDNSEIDENIISESELKTLKKNLHHLTIGEKDLLFNLGEKISIKKLLKNDVSIIYLNSLHNQTDKDFFVSMLTLNIYNHMLQNPSEKLQFLYYIDEISSFLPAGNKQTMSKPMLSLLYKQARKYGVGCIVSTQNPGDIDYKSLGQFSTWAVGRITTKQDIEKIKNIVRDERLPTLKPSEFLMFSPDHLDEIKAVKVRWLESEHKTLTQNDIENKMKGKKENTTEAVRYFPLHINKEDVFKIANKKRFFLFNSKDTIENVSLNLMPYYYIKVQRKEKQFFKESANNYNILFNALNGVPVYVDKEEYYEYGMLKNFIGLSDNSIGLIKNIEKITEKNSKELVEKGIIAKIKERWALKISMPELKDIDSKNLALSDKNIEAKRMIPKISISQIKNLLKFYGQVKVLEHETVYYPAYKVTYSSKDTTYISAVNGKIIKTL